LKEYIFTGGWKMNLSPVEGIDFARKLKIYMASIPDFNEDLKIIIFTDILSLYSVIKILENSPIKIGSPNLFWENIGAYTGEVSPLFLNKIGCNHALVGHPERLTNLKEDSRMVNKKVKAALRNDITPFLIISDRKGSDREKNILQVKNDILNYTNGLKPEDIVKSVIIYEPRWAINTTEAASTDYIIEMVSEIRSFLNKEFGSELGSNIRITYGGGVNENSFKNILKVKVINGISLGRASQDFDYFTSCIDILNDKLNKG